MDIPVNEIAQWVIGPGALAAHYMVMRSKIERVESDLRDGSAKFDKHSDTDMKLIAAITRVETKVDGIGDRLERVEAKVLNGR